MSSIHERIKNRRQELGLSMEDVAKALGVAWQTVQQWEQPDGTAPKRKRMEALAKVLKMAPHVLQYGVTEGGADPNEAQILTFYRGMTPEMRELYEQQGNALYNLSRKTGPSTSDPFNGKKPPK